jgi:hypothetical protein
VSLGDTRTLAKIRFGSSSRVASEGERGTTVGIARVALLLDAFSVCSFCILQFPLDAVLLRQTLVVEM